jgi:hypothetical protein
MLIFSLLLDVAAFAVAFSLFGVAGIVALVVIFAVLN